MAEKVAFELTADPVPIEQAFKRAGLAGQKATELITQEQKAAQAEIDRLAKKLSDLTTIQEKNGLVSTNAQERLNNAIKKTTAELNTASNKAVQLGQIMSKEITKETGLIDALNIRLQRLRTARDQSQDPAKIAKINLLLEAQQNRLQSLSKVPPPPPRRLDEITKETGLINTLSIRLERLKTARDSSNDPTKIQRINQLISEQQIRYNSLTGAVNKQTETVKSATNQGGNFVSQLKLIGAGVVAGFTVSAVINFMQKVTSATAELQSFQARMEGLTGSSELGNQKLNELRQTSQDLGLNFSDMTSNYIQFVSAAKSQGRSAEEAELVFNNMSIAIAGAGVSSEAANRAMLALQQMMGKGTIQAEELKGQLGEALPQAIGWMQEATGKSTKELMKMMEQGQLTADVLLDFSRFAADAMGSNVQNMAEQLNAKTNRLANSWQKFLTQIGSSGIAEAGIDALTMAVDALAFSWGLATLNLGDYLHEQEKAERLASMSESEKAITKQIQAQIKSYGDEEVALSELNKQLEAQRDKLNDVNKIIERNKKSAVFGGYMPVPSQSELDDMKTVEKVLEQELMYLRQSSKEGATITSETKEQRKERENIVQQQEKLNKLVREWMLDSERASEVVSTATVPDWAKGMGKSRDEINRENAIAGAKELQESADAEKIIFNALMTDINHMRAMDEISETEYLNAKLELEEQYAQDVKKTQEDIYEHGKKLDEQELQTKIEKARLIGDTALTLSGLITNANDAESIQLQKQKEQGIISEEAYQQRLSEIKRKQFEADRIAAIAQIAINTAIAVASPSNLASAGALTPFIIGLAAANALVVATRPNPYAEGIKRVRGGQRGMDSVPFIDGDGSPALLMPGEMIVPTDKVNKHGSYLDNMFDGKISPTQSRWASDLFVHNRIDPGLMRYVVSKSSDNSGSRRNSNKELKQLIKAVKNKPVPSFSRDADRIVNAIHSSRWRNYNSNN